MLLSGVGATLGERRGNASQFVAVFFHHTVSLTGTLLRKQTSMLQFTTELNKPEYTISQLIENYCTLWAIELCIMHRMPRAMSV